MSDSGRPSIPEHSVRVGEAREIARQWVLDVGVRASGVVGAFFHGSSAWLPADAMLPPASDVDVIVVVESAEELTKPGKFRFRGVMLDVSYLDRDEIATAEQVLGAYHLAGSFRIPNVIHDPGGVLTQLQEAVAGRFAEQRWVGARCDDAAARVLRNLEATESSDTEEDRFTACVFAAGVVTHILLVAGLVNPTVRTRYVAVRNLLAAYDLSSDYEQLLDLLGCAGFTIEQVRGHLDALAEAFDLAVAVPSPPFFFATDISDIGRAIAIDGSRELMDSGLHREAVFWIAATYARCRKVLRWAGDANAIMRTSQGFARLQADLGIATPELLGERAVAIRTYLPVALRLADAILASNPEIER